MQGALLIQGLKCCILRLQWGMNQLNFISFLEMFLHYIRTQCSHGFCNVFKFYEYKRKE